MFLKLLVCLNHLKCYKVDTKQVYVSCYFSGKKPKFVGQYRVTDSDSLDAAKQAAGAISKTIEAKLSPGPSMCNIRRHGDNSRLHEVGVSVESGNFLAAKVRILLFQK